jgi:hypothetical protein
VTLSPTSVFAQGDTSSLAPTQSIHVVIKDPPSSFYYQAFPQFSAIVRANAVLSAPTEGGITLEFWSPRALGAGTYTDNVQFRLCEDSQCAQPIAGTTVSVPVTYVVTGSPVPLTYFNGIATGTTQFESKSTDTTGGSVAISLNVFDIPPQGLYVKHDNQLAPGAPNFISTVTFRQTGNQTGELRLQLIPPTSMAAGFYSETLQVSLCFDAACTRLVTGSPVSIPLNYIIYASEGRDFTLIELDIKARSVAWDPISQKLYVLRLSESGSSIVVVDPVTGAQGASVAVPDPSLSIVISGDSQFAYVNADFGQAVHRYTLPDLALDGTIHLSNFLQARQIAVAPGASRTLAIQQNSSGTADSVAIYDDLVKRPTDGSLAEGIAWGEDAAKFYSFERSNRKFKTWTVSPSGLALATTTEFTGSSDLTPPFIFHGGLLYGNAGEIFDPATSTFRQPLPGVFGGMLAIDFPQNRAFNYRSGGLDSINVATRTTISSVYPSDKFRPNDTAPVRWGVNGLALTTYDGGLLIMRGTFVTP